MGIPKFFRWLTRRYPLILQNLRREDESPPVDNLYLDLNGIIHNCIHGNDIQKYERISQLEDFEEVWISIMKSIDEIVHIIKPRKLLYLAVDGVAPKAKMNQQRARRFRAAKDTQALREQIMKSGKEAPELFDKNAISPGTNFMYNLNKQLEFYVQYKLNTDEYFRNLNVILQDSSIPGEGEHKMMDFIRQLKLEENYDPNTRHCFYGADADLIMLSLLTHEPHFMIIREEHEVKKTKQGGIQRLDLRKTSNFQIIHISVLREYFELEYKELQNKIKMPFNVERIIDDFAFFCFFIGNDFLPSLNTLDISEGALDSLIDYYKQILPQMDDYITNSGIIYWDRAEPFITKLAEQEHSTFIQRTKEIGKNKDRIVTFDYEIGDQVSKVSKSDLFKSKIRNKINQKKRLLIDELISTKKSKKQKRFFLKKKFQEDDISETLQKQREELIQKYSQLREKLYKEEGKQYEESKKKEDLYDILKGFKSDQLSELNENDIPDSEVSMENLGDEDEQVPIEGEIDLELENKIELQTHLVEQYEEQNLKFMINFVEEYQRDPNNAKKIYYQNKLHFDISTPAGSQEQKRMLKKYLEGLQWVLFYYYRGVQHWRWFYPYHYAPLISDIGQNISNQHLQGKNIIESFEIDTNCSTEQKPYTPFQQLFQILPIKSFHLLPGFYQEIAEQNMIEYFPKDFEIDLNGRALPWEAICLIPFVDEKQALHIESQINDITKLNSEEQKRNTIHYTYYSFIYNVKNIHSQLLRPLESTLKSFRHLEQNLVQKTLLQDYQNVGKRTFAPIIHEKVIRPCRDFPSLYHLNVNGIKFETIYVQEKPFAILNVCIQLTDADQQSEKLGELATQFTKSMNKEAFIDYPFQNECRILSLEDDYASYKIIYDRLSNQERVQKEEVYYNEDKFGQKVWRSIKKYQRQGIALDENMRAFVCVKRFYGMYYSKQTHRYHKDFDDEAFIPLCLLQRSRDITHYKNVQYKIKNPDYLHKNQEVICLLPSLYGVMGTVEEIRPREGEVKVRFNKVREEGKIHDPFIAHKILPGNNQMAYVKKENIKKYIKEQAIEYELRLQKGVLGKIASSYLVGYIDKETGSQQVIDLGLNLRNAKKGVHIPDYVRYIQADNNYDEFQQTYSRQGGKYNNNYKKSYFEYSQECFDIIKQYFLLFPEIFEFLTQEFRNRDMNQKQDRDQKRASIYKLSQLFPEIQTEEERIKKCKIITSWIEAQPISKLNYVEMGFNALTQDLIQMIENERNIVKEQYASIQLQCRNFEMLRPEQVYQQNFPYWITPFKKREISHFNTGDRIINLNSTKREYIPFGFRGTVIGKTTDQIIVLFDEEFFQGSNIQGHCSGYKGAMVSPNNILNLTKEFKDIMMMDKSILSMFTEKLQEVEINNEEEKQIQQQPKRQVYIIDEEQRKQQEINMMLENLIQTPSLQQQQILQQQQFMNELQKIHSSQIQQQPSAEEQQLYIDNDMMIKQTESHQQHLGDNKQLEQIQMQKAMSESQKEGVIINDQYIQKSSLILDQSSQNFISSDFQQLLQLINVAKTIQMTLPQQTSSSESQEGQIIQQNSESQIQQIPQQQQQQQEEEQSHLNVNATAFVPSWKKN